MNEGFATKENIQEKVSLILQGEKGGFLYEDGGVRKKYPNVREEFKEILKLYGKTDEEIEKQLEIELDPYQESDQQLYRILKIMMTAAQKSTVNEVKESAEQTPQTSQTPQIPAEVIDPPKPEKEQTEEQPKAPEPPKNVLPEDEETFTEYLNSALDGKPRAEVLLRKIHERMDVLPALFKSAGIQGEEEREKLLKKFGLHMERKWMEKESENLEVFFDLAEQSALDTHVIHSRFTQWKNYFNRTQRFNAALKEKLDAEVASVNTNESSLNSQSQENVKLSNARAEQEEDEHTLESNDSYHDEDLIKKAANRWKSEDAKVEKPVENNEAETNEQKYQEAYDAWMEAHNQSDATETEYRNALAEHYKNLGEQSWFSGERMKYEYQKLFGLAPKFTDELQALQEKTISMRNAYKRHGAELAIVKYNENGEKNTTDKEQYKRLLAQKLIVKNFAERNNLQQEVIKEKYPEGTSTQKLLETIRNNRYPRIAGTVGTFVLLSLVPDGVGNGGVTGGSRAPAMFSGSVTDQETQSLLNNFYITKHEQVHGVNTENTRTALFDTNIAALEAEFRKKSSNNQDKEAAVTEPDLQQQVPGPPSIERVESEHYKTSDAPAPFNQSGGSVTQPTAESGYATAPASAKIYSESLLESQKISTEANPEVSSDGKHIVTEGQNLWNLVENRYKERLDTLPTETERNIFIDSILDKLSSSEELRQNIGLQRPNIDLIKPGEELNLAALDTIVAEMGKPDIQVDNEAHAAESIHTPTPEAEALQIEIGDMRVGDILVLAEQVSANDHTALSKLESLGIERDYLIQTAEWIRAASGENIDTTQTLSEFSTMQEYEVEPEDSNYIEPENTEPAAETGLESKSQEGDITTAQDETIETVEGKKGLLDGVFGSNGTAGTYEKIKDLTMADLRDILLMDERKRDEWLAKNSISEEGWVNWINWISQKAEPVVPVDQKLRFKEYLASVVAATVVAKKTANNIANV